MYKDMMGKFTLVHRGDKEVVIGFMGSLSAFKLDSGRIHFLAGFYGITRFVDAVPIYTYECRNSLMFTDFLVFKL